MVSNSYSLNLIVNVSIAIIREVYLLGKHFRGTSLYHLMSAIWGSSYRDAGPVIEFRPISIDCSVV